MVEATRRSESLVGELRVVTTERDLALERLLALQGQLFAVKSEARGSEQKDLFLNEAEALAPTAQTLPAEIADEESTTASGHQRKKHGRKPLDPALPRDIVRHELPESECVCAHDGHALVEIGAEVSEQMHVIPEQVRVLQHHRIKYACPCCDLSLKAAPTPARIIPRGLLTEEAQACPSLVARCTDVAHDGRTAGASGRRLRPLARCGQNDLVIALGRNNWLFAGSLRAGKRAAAVMSVVQSAKLNGHDPFAYLKDVRTRLPTHKASRIEELLPHRWMPVAPV